MSLIENRPYLSTVAAPKNRADLSTVGGAENRADLSTALGRQNRADLSTVNGAENRTDLSIDKIEQRRRRAAIGLTALLGEARVHRVTWYAARAHPDRVRASTLERLDRALSRMVVGERAEGNIAAIKKLYLLVAGVVAERCGADIAAVLATACDFSSERPQEESWLIAARVRRVAMYLIAGHMALGNAALGNAIGCSRQAVKKAVREIEDLREREPALDALIARVAALAGSV
jgi:hypothetical protein